MHHPYDSFDPLCKSPFGAACAGSKVHFSILLSAFTLPQSCSLLLYRDDEFETPERCPLSLLESTAGGNRYGCTLQLSERPQLYFYCFEVVCPDGPRQIRKIDAHCGDFSETGELWQLTVYDPAYSVPRLPEHGIIYQIFPDRFCCSGQPKQNVPSDRTLHPTWEEMPEYLPNREGKITNSDYFGGDLEGIRQHLGYLKSLGVSLIYLNPIFEAHSNHRYNVADYFCVDPLLGSTEDFKRLCADAREMGIGILLDGVFSHTGADSVYFNREGRYGGTGAFRDPESPYRSWYKFEEYPNRYHSWWGFDTLPEVREETPDFLEFICGENGVIRHWMRLGAAGFRLDVADELPDIILDRLREAVKAENPNGILIGEVWEDASNKIAYSQRRRYLLGAQLDSVMNYPFMNAVLRYIRYGDSLALYYGVLSILENYPTPSVQLLFNSLSTHDTARAITVLAGEEYMGDDRQWQFEHHFLRSEQYERGRRLLLLAYTLLYFLPGLPCLYYGDEAGLSGWRDPFNRTPYPWGHEDQELISRFQLLGKIYRENPFLQEAPFIPVISTDDLFIYQRRSGGRSLSVIVNRGDIPYDLRSIPSGGKVTIITGRFEHGELYPLSAIVVLREQADEKGALL